MTYALDSNIISYLLKNDSSVYFHLNKALDDGNRCIIPPVAYYEVKRGLLAVKATTKARGFDQLCSEFGIGRMNKLIWDEAIRIYGFLRGQGKLIEDADIFIAAFCIFNNYTLVTHNVKHFELIKKLNLIDWVLDNQAQVPMIGNSEN